TITLFSANDSAEIVTFQDSIGCGPSLTFFGTATQGPAEWTLPNGDMITAFSIYAAEYGPGLYIATLATPNQGCVFTDSIFINPSEVNCVNVEGIVYLDANNTCTQQNSEVGVPMQIVELISVNDFNEEFYAFTDDDGNWSAIVPEGQYHVQVIPPNDLFAVCLPDQLITGGDGSFVSIPLVPSADVCPRVTVDLCIPRIRRCFDSPIWVDYENTGTEVAEDVVITVEIGDWADELTGWFDPMPDAIVQDPNTGVWTATWNVGDLAPFAGGTVNLLVLTCNDDAPLGSAACVQVTAEPNNPCPPADPLWTGASVNVNGECRADSVLFTIQNVGDATMSIPLDYVVVEDGVILMENSGNTAGLAAGEPFPIALPANGSTYHVYATQEPLHPGLTMPIDFVEGCGGEPGSLGFALQFPVSDDAYWIDEDCLPIIGAYDPNDKLAEPRGYGEENFIEPGQPIDYTIRFQNTGTDTAFTVVVRDTLSELLDMSTIRILNATHDMEIYTDSTRGLAFVFENIQLVDSFTNEPGSNGALSFRIWPVADLQPGTRIENTASIYFDFNAPVVTNTYRHTIEEDFVAVSVFDFSPEVENLLVYPNPTNGTATIKLPETVLGRNLTVEIFDALGQLHVRRNYISGTQPQLDLAHLPAGWYTLRLTEGSELLGNGRLLLEKK
ncbi:MAG: T9SS type A sorting domain-containing protein, partial [Bacteroidota bacterium]